MASIASKEEARPEVANAEDCRADLKLASSECCFTLIAAISIASAANVGIAAAFATGGGSVALVFANLTGYAVLLGISRGIEARCSLSKGTKSIAAAAICGACILAVCAGVILLLVWRNAGYILRWLGADSESINEAEQYIRTLSLHLPLLAIAHPLRIIAIGIPHSPVPTLCLGLALGLGLNASISSVRGARDGTGMVAADCFNVLLMACALWRQLPWSAALAECFSTSRGRWKQLASSCVVECLGTCLEHWCYQVVVILSVFLSTGAPSSLMRVLNLDLVPYSLQAAVSSYTCLRAGRLMEEPSAALHSTVVKFLYAGLLLGLANFALVMVYRSVAAAAAVSESRLVLPLLGLIQLANFLHSASRGILAGCQLSDVSTLAAFVSLWLVGIPLSVVLGFVFGLSLVGLFSGLCLGALACATLSVISVLRIPVPQRQTTVKEDELLPLCVEEVEEEEDDDTESDEDDD